MSEHREFVSLVALLRYGSFQTSQMALRQRLIDGDLPSKILTEDAEQSSLYQRATRDVESWREAGEKPLSWLEESYPEQLRDVHDFPPIIFVRGKLVTNDRGVCIVGARNADDEAVEMARAMAAQLVARDWTVVSGLAKGIDTAAHSEALYRGGRTVAVIGNGIDRYYPPQNRYMQQRIERDGLVLSQFWPGMAPTKYSFPMRNAVMSAYANATIIVAADEKSGTRHQARQAVAHGRPVVVMRSVYENTTWGRRIADDSSVLARVVDRADDAVNEAIKMAEFGFSELPYLW